MTMKKEALPRLRVATQIELDAQVAGYIEQLGRTGLYGSTATEVVMTLVLEGLRRAAADGLFEVNR